MRVVVFASARSAEAGLGPDMERVRALARHASVVAVVPMPWAPGAPRGAGAERDAPAHPAGVPVVRPRYLHVPGSGALAGLTMALGARATIRALRADGACDVLFAQHILPEGLAAVLLGRWTGVPVACLGRESDERLRSRVARSVAAFTLDHAAGVAVVARRLAQELGGVRRRRPIAILPNGVDLERFAPGDRARARRLLEVEPSARVVLCVGRLAAGQGVDDLLEAFVRVLADEPDAGLAIVGTGPLRPALERAARRLGIAGRVHFAGDVGEDAIATWMQAADVVAFPSAVAGASSAIREALACGRPVVTTPLADAPRLVTSHSGYLVPVSDPPALAAALGMALRTTWQPAAIRRHVAGMTWERNAEATTHFLETARCA